VRKHSPGILRPWFSASHLPFLESVTVDMLKTAVQRFLFLIEWLPLWAGVFILSSIFFIIFIFSFSITTILDKSPPAAATAAPVAAQPREQAEIIAKQAEIAKQREAQGRKDTLCRYHAACQNYAQVRRVCAAAGNFDNCLRIKLGGDYPLTLQCSDDGQPLNEPTDMPSSVDCFIQN
jgi:hypothetical protein